jgi:chromosome segregation ATPase
MKNRTGMIVLILICVALIVGLIWSQKKAADQREETGSYSNRWMTASEALDKQAQVNAELEKDRTQQKDAFLSLSNTFAQTSATLEQTESSLQATQQEMTNQLARRDAKIGDLETQNQALEQRAAELSASITNLNAQIEDTRAKLAAAQGGNDALTRELQRMMAEKADLERQFNDVSTLRTQLAKIKEEMNISRRLAWQRKGLMTDQKGAEQLMQKYPPYYADQAKQQPQYDLNVEVTVDGRVVPAQTNSAPTSR